jgi:hypothetical protein
MSPVIIQNSVTGMSAIRKSSAFTITKSQMRERHITEHLAHKINAPSGHHSSPLSIAGRLDQSSIEPGASFQFGRTSMRRPRAPHLLHLARQEGISTSPG